MVATISRDELKIKLIADNYFMCLFPSHILTSKYSMHTYHIWRISRLTKLPRVNKFTPILKPSAATSAMSILCGVWAFSRKIFF